MSAVAKRELFVYWRVRTGVVDDARAAATALQSALRAAHRGLEARLLRRGGAGNVDTWMETYALPSSPGGVDAALEAAIEAAAALVLAAFVDGERHVEAFEAVGSS